VLASVASRARRMMENELDNGEEPDARAVTEARRFISERVLEMAGRGEIELNASENAAG
jgi:flagellar motor switch protein FliG